VNDVKTLKAKIRPEEKIGRIYKRATGKNRYP
jgi:hypothetical protein